MKKLLAAAVAAMFSVTASAPAVAAERPDQKERQADKKKDEKKKDENKGSTGSAATTTQKGTQSKSSRGGLDSIKPGEIPPVTTSPEPSTAGALRGRPPTSNTTQAGPLTQALPFPLKALQVNPTDVTGGNRVQGTVELNQAPGPTGLTVTLETSNPQLAGVPPSVTITQGTASAETGPMVKATFPIDTQPVLGGTTVIIRARAGVQTLQANLRIRSPEVQSAWVDGPRHCDGNNKGTVRYTLTGPAPSGLRFQASAGVNPPGSSGAGGESESEAVPAGNSAGSMRIRLYRCKADSTFGDACTIRGFATVVGGNVVSISGFCYPPD